MIEKYIDQTKKPCRKCGEEKVLKEFHKHPGHKYGVSNLCKECRKQYCETHPEIYKKAAKKSYMKNRQKVIEASRIRTENNPKHFRELARKSRNRSITLLTDAYMREYAKRQGHDPLQIDNLRYQLLFKRNLRILNEWFVDFRYQTPIRPRKIYYKAKPEIVAARYMKKLEYVRSKGKNDTANITDNYARKKLKREGIFEIEPWQIELKRQQIIAKRSLKEIKKWREANESNSSVVHG